MTFTELVSAVSEQLNLSGSSTATTRIGTRINDRYKRITSSLGLNVTRRTTVNATMTIGTSTLVFTGIEKIINVVLRTTSPPTVLEETTMEELRRSSLSLTTPTQYAIQNVGYNTVTILTDCTPEEAITVYADGYANLSTLSGATPPAFPESFHDVLYYGALADEYRKMEKVKLAQDAEVMYERRLSDLRFFIAKSGYLDRYQGKTTELTTSLLGSSSSGTFAATTARVDLLASAGEALSAGEAVRASLGNGAESAGSWYLADATDDDDELLEVGFVVNSAASGADTTVRVRGIVTGLTGLVAGSLYYVASGTPGGLTTSPTKRFVGIAQSTTTLLVGVGVVGPGLGTPLGVLYGGLGADMTPAGAGEIPYSTSVSAYGHIAAGTAGHILKAAGAAIPTWNAPAALTKTDDTNVTLTLGGSATTALVNAASLTLGWAGTLSMARGGSAKALAASVGGIVWTDADSMEVLAGTATANQMLQSGASATPAWSTATWPATTTVNQLLYSSAANTVAGLATAASGVLVTSAGGVPSIATDIPTAVTIGGAYVYRVGGTDVAAADGGTAIDTSGSSGLPSINGGTWAVNNVVTAGRVLFGAASNAVSSDAKLYWDNTNKWLGVGAAPAAPLDVKSAGALSGSPLVMTVRNTVNGAQTAFSIGETTGTAVAAGQFASQVQQYGTGQPGDANYEVLSYGFIKNTAAVIGIQAGGTGTRRRLVLSADGTAAASANQLVLATDGNVGIGTTSPLGKIDSRGAFTASESAEIGGPLVVFNTQNQDKAVLAQFFAPGALANSQLNIFGSGDASVLQARRYSTGAIAALAFQTVGGNVGIGTVAPGSALDVKGTLRLSGSSSGYVGLAPAAAAGSVTYTLPSADGTAAQVLSTNGSGLLTWADQTGTGGTGLNSLGGLGATDQYFANDTNVTITSATATHTLGWAGQLGVARGGTNIASYAVGDLLYASAATTLAKLADVAVGQVLVSGGVTTAPAWSGSPKLSGSLLTGSLYASLTNKAPICIWNNPTTVAAGNCVGLWIEINGSPTGSGGNPALDDFVAMYTFMKSDANRTDMWGYNAVLHAAIGADAGLSGIEINIENEGAAPSTAPFVTQAGPKYSKTGITAVLNGGAAYDGTAAFAAAVGNAITSKWLYGYWGQGATTATFMAAKANSALVVNPAVAYDNDTDATTWLRSTGTHTLYIDTPYWDVSETALVMISRANGADAAGQKVTIGQNTTGGGAPGCIEIVDKAGVPWYLWVDSTGDLRIHSAAPTPNAGDVGGTVVGAQS